VTPEESKLIELGTALARSVGHLAVNGNAYHCPKVSSAIPCTCGAGRQQAEALDNWMHFIQELDNGSGVG
jgi:hypothetical protein